MFLQTKFTSTHFPLYRTYQSISGNQIFSPRFTFQNSESATIKLAITYKLSISFRAARTHFPSDPPLWAMRSVGKHKDKSYVPRGLGLGGEDRLAVSERLDWRRRSSTSETGAGKSSGLFSGSLCSGSVTSSVRNIFSLVAAFFLLCKDLGKIWKPRRLWLSVPWQVARELFPG